MSQDRTKTFQIMARKVEWFDLLVVLYITVIVREYFWIVSNNAIAWGLTSIVSLGLAATCLATKEGPPERHPTSYWVIVGLPLLFIYFLRVGYPDLSFDVLNYHIFHSERALRGLLYIPGDFAPAHFPYFNNPAPDMITGLFRHLLGFRLGTIINYLVLLWTGSIIFSFLRDALKDARLRSFAVLLVLLSEQFLFEINTYMVDLLALPLLMQASYYALRDDYDLPPKTKHYILTSLLLGTSVALKLTNLVFALPIGLVVISKLRATTKKRSAQLLAVFALTFALPVLPHALYLYQVTNNPVFPLYNKLFQSPFWPVANTFDGRWGPQGFWQTFFWPFAGWFNQQRLTELSVYSGKLSVGLLAVFLLILLRKEPAIRRLAVIFISSAFLWSLGTGYIRYGLFLDVLGGISLVLLTVHFWNSALRPGILHWGLSLILSGVLVFQGIMALVYTWKIEWGGRSVGLLHPREYRWELSQLLQDRSLTQYMSAAELAIFDEVGGWVETGYQTSAVTAILKPDLPYLNVFAEAFLATPAAVRKFKTAETFLEGRKLLSIIFERENNLQTAVLKLQKRGFKVIKTTPLSLGYFSSRRTIPLTVIEVERDPAGRQTQDLFNARLVVLEGPAKILKPGERATVRVKVQNVSPKNWPSKAIPNGPNQVTLGNKWLDESGRIVVNDDGRTPLPSDLLPQAEFVLDLPILAPTEPGKYVLMLDLVQEQVSWFYEQGSTPVEIEVVVVN